MEWDEIANIALPLLFVLAGIALVWFILELVVTVRRARKAVNELQQQIEPTLSNLEEVTCAMKPIVAKVDPLVERVSLTVDAANLEIMRLDQILENVTDITENASGITSSLSSAVDAIDTISNAPIELVNNVSGKVRHVFKQKKASNASIELGSKEEEKAAIPLSGGSKRAASDKARISEAQRSDETNAAETAASEEDKGSFAGAFKFARVSKSAGDQYFTYTAVPSSDVPVRPAFKGADKAETSPAEDAASVSTGAAFENTVASFTKTADNDSASVVFEHIVASPTDADASVEGETTITE